MVLEMRREVGQNRFKARGIRKGLNSVGFDIGVGDQAPEHDRLQQGQLPMEKVTYPGDDRDG